MPIMSKKHSREFLIRIWGDFACFTMPECKCEQLSYPYPPYSAARGICDSIMLKPEQFQNRILSIGIVKPGRQMYLTWNGVREKLSARAAMNGTLEPIIADHIANPHDPDLKKSDKVGRDQRGMVVLRDVEYVVRMVMVPTMDFENRIHQLENQLERRLQNGQCHRQPYLGLSQFIAHFEPATGNEEIVDINIDAGLMLYDMFDLSDAPTHNRRRLSVHRSVCEHGWISYPSYDSDLVLKETI